MNNIHWFTKDKQSSVPVLQETVWPSLRYFHSAAIANMEEQI